MYLIYIMIYGIAHFYLPNNILEIFTKTYIFNFKYLSTKNHINLI